MGSMGCISGLGFRFHLDREGVGRRKVLQSHGLVEQHSIIGDGSDEEPRQGLVGSDGSISIRHGVVVGIRQRVLPARWIQTSSET